jgi:hypothetical protein
MRATLPRSPYFSRPTHRYTMPTVVSNSTINEFIDRAKAGGASEESIVGILTARGWPEKEVYEALAAHYERVAGMEIPRREGVATAAKDAFFYLLIFATLATWTIGLGSLAFTLIDRWISDALFSTPYSQGSDAFSIAASLSSLLVAFPIFLLVSRSVVRDMRMHPEKLESPVRKWLTYLALVIAAGVLIGDLITALTYLLRGELTSRFLAKAIVVLVLSGGVFYYYFGGLKKSEISSTPGRMRRDGLMAALSTFVVLVAVFLGFWSIGVPSNQRTLRADRKRVQDLYQLSEQIRQRFYGGRKLPDHLDELPSAALADPVTRMGYEYHPSGGSEYDLCATFSMSSQQNDPNPCASQWAHPAGHHCFHLSGAESAENPYTYPSDF